MPSEGFISCSSIYLVLHFVFQRAKGQQTLRKVALREISLSFIYSCNTFNRWRTPRRQEINMRPLLVWIFLDRETYSLICRQYYRKERCLCTAVELSIKQCKEVSQEFDEQLWAWHFWYLWIIYCLLRSSLIRLCTSKCRGSVWCCRLAENGTMKWEPKAKKTAQNV